MKSVDDHFSYQILTVESTTMPATSVSIFEYPILFSLHRLMCGLYLLRYTWFVRTILNRAASIQHRFERPGVRN
ncbi:hypothetical protein [Spirosoma flavus]